MEDDKFYHISNQASQKGKVEDLYVDYLTFKTLKFTAIIFSLNKEKNEHDVKRIFSVIKGLDMQTELEEGRFYDEPSGKVFAFEMFHHPYFMILDQRRIGDIQDLQWHLDQDTYHFYSTVNGGIEWIFVRGNT